MKEIIKKQTELIEKITSSFKSAQAALIKKEIQDLSKNIAMVEEYSLEFEKLEELLLKELNNLGYSSITNYINSTNDKEMSILLATFMEKLNELSIVMSNFKEMLDFENNYFDFVKSLFSNTSQTSTYSKTGYEKVNSSFFNKSY
ncbi:hypothetical protein BG95_02730 [Thermosipho sp. 1063]|uniref:hypothetical protein n=1 Tax=unclassified Thermosipho (in: thermotogales) TaxID=2676525 RepID=UPI00094927DB|nr:MULTISPECIES: hypothetical protein [unclassified Thermosipho (in: thermotogales)]ANQ53431.1 hypothetical protein Y592_02740 [Thermosipho sp. 1070]APT71880.1 hypothetical protein BG95_02730 [Thermosipho sp. 1063]OOC45016.1 hypothetical protein XO08_02710 [Thermosipho sp. 1074]